MDRELIDSLARKAMVKDRAQPMRERGYTYYHGRRVAALALTLNDALKHSEAVDKDLLWAGGLLHDIGKGNKHHAEVGAQQVKKLLKKHLRAEEIEHITDLVRLHNLRNHPEDCPFDARVLQDADVLDHVGLQQVWISIQHCARDDKSPEGLFAYQESEQERHYLALRRASLNFSEAVTEFDRRVAEQKAFYITLAREERGAFGASEQARLLRNTQDALRRVRTADVSAGWQQVRGVSLPGILPPKKT